MIDYKQEIKILLYLKYYKESLNYNSQLLGIMNVL
jgi:hypothetical protein